MDHSERLRRLVLDVQPEDPPCASATPVSLDARTRCLVRFAALVAVDASSPSVRHEIDHAVSEGASAEDIVDVLEAIVPLVGRAKVVTAAPRVAVALGVDLDLLGEY